MRFLFLPPLSQRSWRLAAIINFAFTGAGAGSYMISFYIESLSTWGQYTWHFAAFRLSAILLTCLGFLIVASEVRRPDRTRYLLSNIESSWMSREALTLVIFLSSAFIEIVHTSSVTRTISSAAALLLIVSQGFMVYRSRALSAWNVPGMPLLFLSSGLVSGYGLILVVAALFIQTPEQSAYMLGMFLIVFNVVIWLYYLGRRWSLEFIESTRNIRSHLSFILIMGIGHALPLILLLLIMMNLTGIVNRIIVLASGLILFGVGPLMKAGIVIVSGNVRRISLKFDDHAE